MQKICQCVEIDYPKIENFKPVRRGVGLFLMSTAVNFYHPTKQQYVSVKCDLAPKFEQVLRKAKRGSDWIGRHDEYIYNGTQY